MRSGSRMLRHPISTSTSGTSHATLPTDPATTVRTALHHGAGQLPPDGGRGDDGQPDDEQPDAVASLLGVEVAGAAPDRPGDGADRVRDAEPDRGHPAAERGEGPEDRPGPAADGARRGLRVRVGARLLEDRFLRPVLVVVLRDRVLEPPPPDPPDRLGRPDLDVLLLREPGGEDVRVAMTPNVCHRHSSHTDHTAVSADGPRSGPGAGRRFFLRDAGPRRGVSLRCPRYMNRGRSAPSPITEPRWSPREATEVRRQPGLRGRSADRRPGGPTGRGRRHTGTRSRGARAIARPEGPRGGPRLRQGQHLQGHRQGVVVARRSQRRPLPRQRRAPPREGRVLPEAVLPGVRRAQPSAGARRSDQGRPGLPALHLHAALPRHPGLRVDAEGARGQEGEPHLRQRRPRAGAQPRSHQERRPASSGSQGRRRRARRSPG